MRRVTLRHLFNIRCQHLCLRNAKWLDGNYTMNWERWARSYRGPISAIISPLVLDWLRETTRNLSRLCVSAKIERGQLYCVSGNFPPYSDCTRLESMQIECATYWQFLFSSRCVIRKFKNATAVIFFILATCLNLEGSSALVWRWPFCAETCCRSKYCNMH